MSTKKAKKAKKAKVNRSEKHYQLVMFYARTYRPAFNSIEEANQWIKVRKLISKSHCYVEVWEMKNETDGRC